MDQLVILHKQFRVGDNLSFGIIPLSQFFIFALKCLHQNSFSLFIVVVVEDDGKTGCSDRVVTSLNNEQFTYR
jgi:hypothetical protein